MLLIEECRFSLWFSASFLTNFYNFMPISALLSITRHSNINFADSGLTSLHGMYFATRSSSYRIAEEGEMKTTPHPQFDQSLDIGESFTT